MKKYILLLFLMCCLGVSCDGFLDQQSRSQVDADKMFETDQGFKDVITGCYTKMASKTLYGENLTMTRLELMAQHWDLEASTSEDRTLIAFKDLDFSTDDSRNFFSTVFGAQYNVIVQANDILLSLPSKGHNIKSPATRSIIEAEALAIRAFCHFDILRLFGQMPVNANRKVSLPYAETVGKQAVPTYDYEAFLTLVMRDLEEAEKILAENDPLVEYTLSEMDADNAANLVDDSFLRYRRFRFNLYAVKALRARVYLYWGKTTEAHRYAREVIDAVSEAGQPMVSLAGEADLNSDWLALPTECLLALNDPALSGDIFHVDKYRLTKYNFDRLFQGRNTSSNNRMLKVWDGAAKNSANTVLPIIKKYNQPTTEQNVDNVIKATRRQVIPLIRLSEMYLIVMETGTLAEANQLYPPYMLARNEVVTGDLTQDQLTTLIEEEYRREFFAEGQMFYYYKRKGSQSMLWQGANLGTITENNYVVPIPDSDLKINDK